MKILMATMGLEIGGAETHIVELAIELQGQGHEILVASAGGVYVPQIEEAGVRHFEVPMHRRNVNDLMKAKRLLKKIIQKEKPDVVHAHARIPGFLCGLLHKRMKFPFVTTAHWVFRTHGMLRFLTNWGQRVMAVSEDIKTYLVKEYDYPSQHISVTINGIDTEKFSPTQTGETIREEFNVPDGVPILVSVSRMDMDRGLVAQQLVTIAPALCRAVPDLVIFLVGGGNMLDELVMQAQQVNLSLGRRAVILPGARTDINQFVALADLFVGVSRSALEAMSAEKMTIVAGNEGYQGLFTPSSLREAIAGNFCCRGMEMSTPEKLKEDVLYAMRLSPEKIAELGDYGRQVILTHYSASRMANDCVKMYEDVLAKPYRLLVSGYYGFDNAGDDAILQAINQQVKESGSERPMEVVVLSNDPKETAERYGLDTVPRFQLEKVLKEIKRCDALLSGGGSLLQDRTSTRSILYYLGVIRVAQIFHKPVMLYANGIGPVTKKANRRRVKRAVEGATVVSLRDLDSAEELKAMGVTREDLHITADPVQALSPVSRERGLAYLESLGIYREFVTISVRDWEEMTKFKWELAQLCDAIHNEYNLQILFVCMQPDRDYEASKEVQLKMTAPSRVLSKKIEPELLMSVLGQAKLCVAMRLHTLIFSARMGVPLLGLVYDPKVESYLKELEQPSGGSLGKFKASEAMEHVRGLLENYTANHEKVLAHSQRLEALAGENKKLLLEMLENQ